MRSYELFGESLPSMALARAAALASRDKVVADVRSAAEAAADRLEAQIAGYVRPSWPCTATPAGSWCSPPRRRRTWSAPLARRLGFDHVVATRYATQTGADGVERYTGGLDGGFVWSIGKLRAVRRWAEAQGVDLSQSWAYSDSIYDLPLLGAVGHPTAVNPDARLLATAVDAALAGTAPGRPAGVPKMLGVEPLDLMKVFFGRVSFPYARFDIAGAEHIPRHGAAIVAANHRSYFDVAAYGLTVFEAGRRPRGIAKKELVDAPVIGPMFRAFGAIRVDRDQQGAGRRPTRRPSRRSAPARCSSSARRGPFLAARRSSTPSCGERPEQPDWPPLPARRSSRWACGAASRSGLGRRASPTSRTCCRHRRSGCASGRPSSG